VVDDVARALEESGLPPASLVLEMTESVLLDDSETVLDILRQLKALGAPAGRRAVHLRSEAGVAAFGMWAFGRGSS
jgi:predicted signal transduction protein with EAL and GGDEF domain